MILSLQECYTEEEADVKEIIVHPTNRSCLKHFIISHGSGLGPLVYCMYYMMP